MNTNKNTMRKLFNVLEIESIKILLKGIEREKGIHSQKAMTIISKEQAMVYLDEVLEKNDVCALKDFQSIKYIAKQEVIDRANQNRKLAYNSELFQKHKLIISTSLSKHNLLKRVKYLLNPKECLLCK